MSCRHCAPARGSQVKPGDDKECEFNCQTAAHACFRHASSAPGWSGSGLAGLVCPKTPERVCGTRLSDQPRPRPRVWWWFKYTRACFTLDAVSRLRSARDGLTGLLASRLRVHLSWPHTIRFSRHVRTIARDALGPDCPMTPSSAASATEHTNVRSRYRPGLTGDRRLPPREP